MDENECLVHSNNYKPTYKPNLSLRGLTNNALQRLKKVCNLNFKSFAVNKFL